MADTTPGVVNAMSVDVEDYFHVSAFEDHIRREDWDRLPCRVEQNVERVLALFAEHDVKTTFFTLGWVAERYPHLVRSIVDGGHELASHGQSHVRVQNQNPTEFREDVIRSKELLGVLGREDLLASGRLHDTHHVLRRGHPSTGATAHGPLVGKVLRLILDPEPTGGAMQARFARVARRAPRRSAP